ncbi:MAG: MBL fold metallo-hydrolase [Clostridia bacterium]|nr:MBL fold metallo-hydrolase [Clostridia bacterium]
MQTKFYRSEQVAPGVHRIFGLCGELCYLVTGSEKALLIDTATGVGDIREIVSGITDLPLQVVNTHAHLDHVGGNFVFDEVYIHPADQALLAEQGQAGLRANLFESRKNLSEFAQGIAVKPGDFTDYRELVLYPAVDGDRFDLGGRTLEVIEVPGHTYGSIALLDRANRQIFMGDACNSSTLLIPGHSTSVEEYREALVRLHNMVDLFDRFFVFHGEGELPKTCIEDVLLICDEILAGKNAGVLYVHLSSAFEGGGFKGIRARNYPSMSIQPDGRCGNLVYTAEGIYKKQEA